MRGGVDGSAEDLALVSFGLGCGLAVDRVEAARQRTAVYEEERQALQQRNRQLMAIELQATGRHPAFQHEWQQRLDRVQEAVVLYLTALYRAQAQRSLEGILRVAEAFAALGDAAAVQSCMVMAGRVADPIPRARSACRSSPSASASSPVPASAFDTFLTASLH